MRNAFWGIGIGAVMVLVMYIGRGISNDLSGRNWPVRPMRLDFRDMPKELGAWSVADSSDLAPDVFAELGAVDAEQRTYKSGSGVQVACHVSVFEKFTPYLIHSPLSCYPAQGWELLDQNKVEIPLSDGTVFSPTLLSFEKDGSKVLVLFWFQCGEIVVADGYEQRYALDHYRADREWPSELKVMLHMPVDSNYQDTSSLKDLAARIYEYTRTLP